MADIAKILGGSLKDKVLGVTKTQKVVKENPNTLLKIVGKNFMSLPGFARDLNVARQNIQKLVKLEGGKPSTGADAYFLKSSEREKKLEVEMASKKPTPTAGQVLKKNLIRIALFKLLQIVFTSFVKVVGKYFTPLIILGAIFVGFKDAFAEWATGLWESIKTSFGEFVESIKKWFEESVQPIIDKVKDFIKPITDTISNFFKKVGDFFSGYFEAWSGLIKGPIQSVKSIYDGFMNKVNGIIDILPNWVKEKLGISKKGEPAQVDDSAERKKLERQQSEPERKKQEAQREAEETERVKKLEKEKQYTGDDEIVRQRLGLPPKTETMKREVEAKKKEAIQPAPTPEALVVPGPAPAAPPPPTTPSAAAPKPTPKAAAPAKAPEKPLEVSGIQATIVKSLNDSGITSPKAHANVLATVKAESNFKVQSENLNYSSPDRIQAVFGPKRIPSPEFAQQFVKNPEALANYVYKTTDGNSSPGDGFKYRGRGFIQHTGKNQYAAISKFTGVDVVSNPDALNSPEVAAKAIPWFLLSYKGLKPDDVENMSKVNKAIAFSDPTGKKAAERESSAQQIYASMSSGSGTQVASASTDIASGQRQQAKPQTPMVVNAPTNNTTVVNKTQVTSSKQQDTGRMLAGAAA